MFKITLGSLSFTTVCADERFCDAPHFGHDGANSEIISPHSLQCTNAIKTP